MSNTEHTRVNRWPLRLVGFFAVVLSLVAGLLFVRIVFLKSHLSASRSVTTSLIVGQPAADIQMRLARVATEIQSSKELDFGAAPYSAEALYFSHGIFMIRVGTSNGLVTDFDIRKFEFK